MPPRWMARTRTWREWFFEVVASSGPMPFNPLPMTDAERREHAEQTDHNVPENITRLNLSSGGAKQAARE